MLAQVLVKLATAAATGLAIAAAGWMAFGSSDVKTELASLKSRVNPATARPRSNDGKIQEALTAVRTTPLFGAGPLLPETLVRLDGVSRNGPRAAALVSINNGPAQWLSKGDTQAGVTVVDVQFGQIVLETADGQKILALGQSTAPPTTPASTFLPSEKIPAGLHMPPPPASAPRT